MTGKLLCPASHNAPFFIKKQNSFGTEHSPSASRAEPVRESGAWIKENTASRCCEPDYYMGFLLPKENKWKRKHKTNSFGMERSPHVPRAEPVRESGARIKENTARRCCEPDYYTVLLQR
ncbi:hypothetical protein NDU88_004841 [Pleurodeles waltl]|uniref:Uncharacterized protein n=1 Tax=Pleurodeles waltl TaxID=8319 RepID=A0AAV7SK36_PLEWA|nr:hypothetical protein NDU88_004841 [Pleurodeles waltl]